MSESEKGECLKIMRLVGKKVGICVGVGENKEVPEDVITLCILERESEGSETARQTKVGITTEEGVRLARALIQAEVIYQNLWWKNQKKADNQGAQTLEEK